MRLLALVLLILSVLLNRSVFAASAGKGVAFRNGSSAKQVQKKYKDGEILVKFKQDVAAGKKKNLHKEHGSEVVREFASLRLHHVKVKKGLSVEEAVRLYRSDPAVEYAEPDYLYSVKTQPNDPQFTSLWGLQNTGLMGGTAGADIKALPAWDFTTGSREVVVLIIDTGIDYTHPDLSANIYDEPGIDVVNNDTDPFDDFGHGTHVAGIIGAVGNNGTGVTGVNWQVKLASCKFLGADGTGSTDGALQCLDYLKSLRDAGVKVVAANNSWGGGDYSQALYEAIKAQPDVLFVMAAGNDGADNDASTVYPASYDLPNILTVAATDNKDSKAIFSNYGRRSTQLGAPGVNILSTLPEWNVWRLDWGYGLLSGTSMATPHVTGAAALLKAYNPTLGASAIKNLLLAGGDSDPSLNGRSVTGKRLNAYGALTCANRPLLSLLQVPPDLQVGVPVTTSVLSIDCGAAVGPVTATLKGGETVKFVDDGTLGDLVAGDGIFTATWTPTRFWETLRVSSQAGSDAVSFPAMYVDVPFLPNGTLGSPYAQALSPRYGDGPYSWSMTGGSLPPGLALDASGTISGTPTSPGSYYLTAEVTDVYGVKAYKDLSVSVNPSGISETWRCVIKPGGSIYTTADYGGGRVSDVAVDADGNSYVVSSIGSGGDIFHPAPYQIFLVKLAPSGEELWRKRYLDPSANYMFSRTVAAGGDGSVYVGGLWQDGSGDYCFLTRFDRDGNLLWTRRHAGQGANDVVVDAAGSVFLAAGASDWWSVVVVKYDAEGNLLWEQQPEAGGYNPFIAVDRGGNLFLTYYDEPTSTTTGLQVAKLDPSGTILWQTSFHRALRETSQDIAIDNNGDVLVTGWDDTVPRLFVVKFKSTTGERLWNRGYTAGLGVKGFGLAVDKLNQIYVTGSYQGTPYAEPDLLVLKYDASGNRLWAATTDAGSSERGERIAVAPNGDLVITGATDYLWGGYSGMITTTLKDSSLQTLSYSRLGSGTGSVGMAPGPTCTGPCSQYYQSGTQVTLTATADSGSSFVGWGGACSGTGACLVTMDAGKAVTASFQPRPVAELSAPVTTGPAPLAVSFSDSSTGAPASWLWNFGDGATSTLQNPTHVYSSPGSYTVSLSVTGPGGTASVEKPNLITAVDPGPAAIQPLYDVAADGAAIRVRDGQLTESPIFNRDIVVRIGGGYDFPLQSVVGATTIHGAITIRNGRVLLDGRIRIN